MSFTSGILLMSCIGAQRHDIPSRGDGFANHIIGFLSDNLTDDLQVHSSVSKFGRFVPSKTSDDSRFVHRRTVGDDTDQSEYRAVRATN